MPAPDDSLNRFRQQSGNLSFRVSRLTYLTLFVLLILYPALSIGFTADASDILKNLNEGTRIVMLVQTIVLEWLIFLLLLVTSFRERTLLAGLGFRRIRLLDLLWAIAFLAASWTILAGLTWFLARIGLPMPGEISMLIPNDLPGRLVWVAVSFTAGFCEEAAFRGYLMTRLRLLGKLRSWVVPAIVSSMIFGACHAYQGLPGFIVISVYGLLFSLLYIRTGTIWPCVIAHSFQDFLALFIPQ